MKSLRVSNAELSFIEEESLQVGVQEAVRRFLTRKEFVKEPYELRAPEYAALRYFFYLPAGRAAPHIAIRSWIKAYEEGAIQDGQAVSVSFPEIDLYIKS